MLGVKRTVNDKIKLNRVSVAACFFSLHCWSVLISLNLTQPDSPTSLHNLPHNNMHEFGTVHSLFHASYVVFLLRLMHVFSITAKNANAIASKRKITRRNYFFKYIFVQIERYRWPRTCEEFSVYSQFHLSHSNWNRSLPLCENPFYPV